VHICTNLVSTELLIAFKITLLQICDKRGNISIFIDFYLFAFIIIFFKYDNNIIVYFISSCALLNNIYTLEAFETLQSFVSGLFKLHVCLSLIAYFASSSASRASHDAA